MHEKLKCVDLVDLKESILTYIDALDKLVIWRNSEISGSDIFDVLGDNLKAKIVVLGNGENLFIAGALNCVIEYARTNGYTHILTMDQDSKFGQEDAKKYRKIIEDDDNYNNVIFCPLVVSTKGIKEQRGEGIEKVYKNQILSKKPLLHVTITIFTPSKIFRNNP